MKRKAGKEKLKREKSESTLSVETESEKVIENGKFIIVFSMK